MAYYKVVDAYGNGLRHFVKVEGDDTAQKQVAKYVKEGMSVELWESSLGFQDEKVRDVPIDEIRESVAA